MRIGIIGIGSITMDLAYRAVKAGHKILISNPRGNNITKSIMQKMGDNVKTGSIHEAALAQILIVFVTKVDLEELINQLPDMSGKIILHTNNPLFHKKCFSSLEDPKSSSEILTSLLPRANIVKIFNPLEPIKLSSNQESQDKIEVFFTGKNQMAKNIAKLFLETLNLAPVDIAQSHGVVLY